MVPIFKQNRALAFIYKALVAIKTVVFLLLAGLMFWLALVGQEQSIAADESGRLTFALSELRSRPLQQMVMRLSHCYT